LLLQTPNGKRSFDSIPKQFLQLTEEVWRPNNARLNWAVIRLWGLEPIQTNKSHEILCLFDQNLSVRTWKGIWADSKPWKWNSGSMAINHKVTLQETVPRNDRDWIEAQFDRQTLNLRSCDCLPIQSFVWSPSKLTAQQYYQGQKCAYLGFHACLPQNIGVLMR
jgi:hypothetical protein